MSPDAARSKCVLRDQTDAPIKPATDKVTNANVYHFMLRRSSCGTSRVTGYARKIFHFKTA